jgi:hypothetical protein
MSENHKKLGMRERPHKERHRHKKSGEESSDSSSEQGSEPAAKRPVKKRRKSFADSPGAGDKNLGAEPNQKKKRSQLVPEPRDREACEQQSASREDREAPQKSDQSLISSGSSDEEQPANKRHRLKSIRTQTGWNLLQSPLRTSIQIAEAPDSSLLGNGILPPPSFTTVVEVLDTIPTSGISMLRVTELLRDRE